MHCHGGRRAICGMAPVAFHLPGQIGGSRSSISAFVIDGQRPPLVDHRRRPQPRLNRRRRHRPEPRKHRRRARHPHGGRAFAPQLRARAPVPQTRRRPRRRLSEFHQPHLRAAALLPNLGRTPPLHLRGRRHPLFNRPPHDDGLNPSCAYASGRDALRRRITKNSGSKPGPRARIRTPSIPRRCAGARDGRS